MSLTSMRTRVILSSTLGNALEWFDFTVFGLLVVVIAENFFPAGDPTTSLLKTFATFGIAFVARPLGGLIFGLYADRYGRKRALVTMIWMMAIGTGLIGLLPTYDQIGLLAPLLILFCRLIQGLSAGGEFGSASALLIEFAPPGRSGLFGSFQTVSQSLAFALGASTAYALQANLDPADYHRWGWRIPFLLGVIIGPVGSFMRHRVAESPAFAEPPPPLPVGNLWRHYRRQLAVAFCVTASTTALTYVTCIFLPAHASKHLGLPMVKAQLGLIVTNLIGACLAPMAGHLSDRWGRRAVILPLLLLYGALFALFLPPLFQNPSVEALWRLQAVGLLMGALAGPMPALMTEIFPVGLRSTGASLTYNLAVMLFGGLAPFINTALFKIHPLAPLGYIGLAVVMGLIGLALHRPHHLQGE
jgi:MHS family proline/betaine transporter-like MFS transporter